MGLALLSGAAPTYARCTTDPKNSAETGPLRPQNVGQPWSFTRQGGTDRFEVRSGDHLPGDGSVKERSEAYSTRKLAVRTLYEISFEVMVVPGGSNTATWMTLAQLQSTFDKGENGHSPPFALEMVGERMRIVSRADPRRISRKNDFTFTKQYQDTANIRRGKWYRFRMLVKFDPSGGGSLAVWRDGVRLVDYHGALGFDDVEGAYFKQGVYRASAPEAFAARFRRLSICAAG